MSQPVIHFDYDFSPYGQKTKLLLTAANVQFTKVDQPMVLPRPDLEALGITFRRIPLMAVGKDVYCDSALIVDTIVHSLGKIQSSPHDKAYQAWGDATFQEALALIPGQALTPDFVKDRQTIFPILKRSDLKTLRPSALGAFKARLSQVENDFLGASSGPFIGGEKVSVADVHVVWSIRWVLNSLGVSNEAGCGKEDFPKVWKMIESLPEAKPEVIGAEQAQKTIKEGEYAAGSSTDVQEGDALNIKEGAKVNIESADAESGVHPQTGKLISTSANEVVIEVHDGIRLHFPRIGYIVRAEKLPVYDRSTSFMSFLLLRKAAKAAGYSVEDPRD